MCMPELLVFSVRGKVGLPDGAEPGDCKAAKAWMTICIVCMYSGVQTYIVVQLQ